VPPTFLSSGLINPQAIALLNPGVVHRGNSDSSKITESPVDVGYWSDEWGVGGKSGAKISLSKQIVRKASVEGKIKIRNYV
jgi:hypothetical protein